MSDSEIDQAINTARRRRQDYLDRIHLQTRSQVSEHERETRQETTDDDEDQEAY